MRTRTSPRRSTRRCRRSSAPSARARSCGSARTQKPVEIETISTGSLGLDIALGVGGLPRGPRDRDLRAGILRQDDARAAHHRRGAEEGRRLRLRRRRARARPDLCPQARRQSRRPPDLAARHRRAGARDRRHARALRRHRRARHRFGRGADPEGRDRRRDGRRAAGPAGPADEPGAAQAHRLDLALEHDGDLHQPDPHEDRRHVRLAGDDDRRQRAQVLRLGAPRHPPHLDAQGARRGDRQPGPRQGGQEQGRAALQAGRVRHHVRRGHLQGRRARRPRRQGRHGREVGRLVLLRQPAPRPGPRERQEPSCASNPDIANRIEAAIRQNSGLVAERILENATPTEEDLDEGVA